ncbi:MAG: site-specific tyrosine recombinase XerD [Alphaproteobacteria bacterium]|nr:site-specific tyrosine recombinase XerD [Alphaproteobacteria bacterium]
MTDHTLESFLEMLAAERGASQNTRDAYRRDLTDLSSFLVTKQTSPEKADTEDLRLYLHHLHDAGLHPRTVARRLSAIKQFYRFALSEEFRSDNPAQALEGPKLPKTLPKLADNKQIDALLHAATEYESPDAERNTALIELLYGAGLRVSELVNMTLQTAKAGLQSGYLIIKGKGNKERLAPLNPHATAAIESWLEVRPDKTVWLFPSRGAKPITRQRCGQLIKELALKAGLNPSKLSPHVMRHSFATHLLSGGADLRVVQELLGHADISTTQVYTHVANPALQKLVTSKHPLRKHK